MIAGSAGTSDAIDYVAEMVDLRDDVIASHDGIDAAVATHNDYVALKNQINTQSENIPTATDSVQALVKIKETLVSRGGDNELAAANAGELITLRDSLNYDEDTNLVAGRNLRALLEMQTDLASRTEEVITAVQSLEILSDLRDELDGQLHTLTELRRQFIELAMNENTINRAMNVIKPLVEASNLRYMNDSQVRDVARRFLDKRNERIAAEPNTVPVRNASSTQIIK